MAPTQILLPRSGAILKSRVSHPSSSPGSPNEAGGGDWSLVSPGFVEPFLQQRFGFRLHFIERYAHSHIRLRVNYPTHRIDRLLLICDLDPYGSAERKWVQHVHVAAMAAQLARASGHPHFGLQFGDLRGRKERVAWAPAAFIHVQCPPD